MSPCPLHPTPHGPPPHCSYHCVSLSLNPASFLLYEEEEEEEETGLEGSLSSHNIT